MPRNLKESLKDLSQLPTEALIASARRYEPERFGPEKLRQYVDLFEDGSEITPERLAVIQPAYANFRQRGDIHHMLYSREGFCFDPIETRHAMVAVLGPSASGKDSILDLVVNHYEYITVVTTTTRPVRLRRGAGVTEDLEARYKFMSKEEFLRRKEEGEFAESLPADVQGEHLYGTSIAALKRALRRDLPLVVWRGELVGWMTLQPWMAENHPEVTTATFFVLPYLMTMKEYFGRIINKRGEKEAYDWRIPKSVWEIDTAGELADVLVLNPPDPSQLEEPFEAAGAMVQAFRRLG